MKQQSNTLFDLKKRMKKILAPRGVWTHGLSGETIGKKTTQALNQLGHGVIHKEFIATISF